MGAELQSGAARLSAVLISVQPVNAEALLAAMRVADPNARPFLAKALERCLSVEWLGAFLAADIHSLRTELSLQFTDRSLRDLRGLSELGPARAFLDRRLGALAYLEHLRALLLLGLLNAQRMRISDSALGRLSRLITGLSERAEHPLRPQLIRLGTSATLNEVLAILSETFQGDDSDRSRDFHRIWIPLLKRSLEASEPVAPSARKPVQRTQSPVASRSGRTWVTTRHVPRPRQQGIDPVAAEAEATVIGVSVDPDDVPDSESYEVFFAERAGRRANSLLIDGHIDALTNEEAAHLAAALLQQSRVDSDPAKKAACLATLLMIATGCSADDLQELELATQPPKMDRLRLILDLHSGSLWRPILFDHAPAPEMIGPAHWIQLPLPPTLVRQLGSLRHSGWMDILGEKPVSHIRVLTDSLGVPSRNYSPGRIRHWISVALQQVGGDLAATMLICGDTFARSSAPLYYYSPKHSSLETIYRKAVWPVFGDGESTDVQPIRENRVGFATLVSKASAVEAMTALRVKNRHRENTKQEATTSIYQHHNRFCDEVVGHFLLITSHRPTDAIQRIRRDDLSLEDGLAVITDKRVDAAHWFRPAAMSKSLCAHLERYFHHLGALAEEPAINDAARSAAQAALMARDGLFFHLGLAGHRVTLSIAEWKSGLPPCWGHLAPNWYRCYLSMNLRERGVPAQHIMMQMGHLEAADYPLSQSSPLRLLDWCNAVRPSLEAVSVQMELGFTVNPVVPGRPPALDVIDWSRRLRLRARGMARIQESIQRQFQRVVSQQRDEITDEVLKIIAHHAPELELALRTRSAPNSDAEPSNSKILKETDFAAIVEDVENHSDDPLLSLALRFELSRQLRRARKALHWETPRYAAVALARGADATPLFPQMMLARRQMLALREYWLKSSRPSAPFDQRAFTVLGLAIWLPDASRERIARIVANISEGFRVSGVADLVLLPGSACSEALRAFAALIGSQLRTDPSAPWILDSVAWNDLGEAITRLLHPDFQANPTTVIDQIIAIAQVNSILEQSPLARLASDRRYCLAAPAEEQAAFLSDAFLPRRQEKTDLPTAVIGAEQRIPTEGRPSLDDIHKKIRAEHQVLRSIVRLEPGTHKTFPLTGVTIKADRIAQHAQAAMLEELAAFRKRGCSSIIEGLARFIEELLQNGTVMRDDPSLGTVKTYLGSIARRLIEKFRDADLAALDPEDIVDRYTEIIVEATGRATDDQRAKEAVDKKIKSHARVGSQLLAFHRVVVRDLHVAPIDANDLPIDNEDLPEDELEGGAVGVVTLAEYDATRRRMHSWGEKPDLSPELRRMIAGASVQIILMYRGGLRIQESTCLMLDDVSLLGQVPRVIVRNNGFRKTKNPLRRRLVPLLKLSESEREELATWCHQQRTLLEANGSGNGPLFSRALDIRSVYTANQVRAIITAALEVSSGRHLWPHLLRHSAVCTALIDVFKEAGANSPAPRDIRRVSDGFGHVQSITTIHYFHFPSQSQCWQPALPEGVSDRHALAVLSGRSKAANDKAIQRSAKGITALECILGIAWPLADPAEIPTPTTEEDQIPIRQVPVDFIGALDRRLRLLAKLRRADKSERSLGWTVRETADIDVAVTWLEQRTGYDVLSKQTPRIKDLTRRGIPLEDLACSDHRVREMADWFVEWYRRDDARRYGGFRCPPEAAEKARQLLTELGCKVEVVNVESLAHRDRVRAALLKVMHPDDARSLTANIARLLAVVAISQRLSPDAT